VPSARRPIGTMIVSTQRSEVFTVTPISGASASWISVAGTIWLAPANAARYPPSSSSDRIAPLLNRLKRPTTASRGTPTTRSHTAFIATSRPSSR
jgi:hypothetical protein